MPHLLLICVQIICFCLTWALATFQLQPFLELLKFFHGGELTSIPEWTKHANYLFALIFLTTGISAVIRLRVLKNLTSTSLTFLLVLLLGMSFIPELYFANILKYSYIVLIPWVFYKIFSQNIRNIDKWIKTTLQISLIYVPFGVGLYLFNDPYVHHVIAVIITSTLTLVSVGASFGLYLKDYFRTSLLCAEWVFFIGFATDLFQLFSKGFEYNQLPMVILGISLVLFARWSRIVTKEKA